MRDLITTLCICFSFFLVSGQAKSQQPVNPEPANSVAEINKQQVQTINIPMDLSTRRPVVELMINGKGPYEFIFDTGSMTHVIDEKLSEAFGFEVVGEDPLRTPGSDKKLVSKRVAVPKVGFAGTNILKDVEMNIINLRSMLPVDGVLSSNFFEEYLLTMDYPASKLEITLGTLNANDDGVIPFIQKPRVINLNLDVDGIVVEAHLDTGSPCGISLPYALKDQLTLQNEPTDGQTARTPVASFKRWEATLNGKASMGSVVFNNPNIALIEGFEYANLGYGVIKDLRTTIDRKNSLIKFEQLATDNLAIKTMMPDMTAPSASFAGTYGGNRKVWQNRAGELEYQREGSPLALKLIEKDDDIYEMKVPSGVRAPMGIPEIHFIRNKEKLITAIKLVYNNRTEGPFKKIVN